MKKRQCKTAVILIGFIVFLLAGDVMAASMDTEQEQIPQEYGRRQRFRRFAGYGPVDRPEFDPNSERPFQQRGRRERLGRGEGERPIDTKAERSPRHGRGLRRDQEQGRQAGGVITQEERRHLRQRRPLREDIEQGRRIGRNAGEGRGQRRGLRRHTCRCPVCGSALRLHEVEGFGQKHGLHQDRERGCETGRGIDGERRRQFRQRRALRRGLGRGPVEEQEYPPEVEPEIEN